MLKVAYMDYLGNWGDSISPLLVQKISKQKVKRVKGNDMSSGLRYAVTGSIISWLKNPETIIWGSGFISEDRSTHVRFDEICAVRGPLTRSKLLKLGYRCPEVYGDPALLMPEFYKPNVNKQYKIGIIPHYIDKDSVWLNKFKNDQTVKIIDISNTKEELESGRFIQDVLSCDMILSTSLHGIIAADAYGIPNVWIELSDKVIGNGFKFRDYFQSVKRDIKFPYIVTQQTKLSDITDSFKEYKISIDLNKLYNACPFKSRMI